MPSAGSGLEDFSFCSFQWAQRGHPAALPGTNHGETPSFPWALSGQALGPGGWVGEVISHFCWPLFPAVHP